ncbi:mucin-3A-like isoform X2 [Leptidea sinapis]|uniref:mucin-3A-like isoform X2 n=1 Tax=Leptidea sinapis TaxID=189913 RepID=UPI0021C369A6|nr:mucin-3A-like isoform X2 [Leptidea sinapis]
MELRLPLIVLTLLQLCPAEIPNSIPSWYAANLINEANYTPKPITEIFTTDQTFSPENPIVVVQSTPSPNNGDQATSPISNRYDQAITNTQGFTQSTGFTQNLFPRLVSQQDGSTQRLLFPLSENLSTNSQIYSSQSDTQSRRSTGPGVFAHPDVANFLEPLQRLLQDNTKLLPPQTPSLSTYSTSSPISTTPLPTIAQTQPEIGSSSYSQNLPPLPSSPTISSLQYSQSLPPLPSSPDTSSLQYSQNLPPLPSSPDTSSLQYSQNLPSLPSSTLTTYSDITRSTASPIESSSPPSTFVTETLPPTRYSITPTWPPSSEYPTSELTDFRKLPKLHQKIPTKHLDNNIIANKNILDRKGRRYYSRFVSRYNTSIHHITTPSTPTTPSPVPYTESKYTELYTTQSPEYSETYYTEPPRKRKNKENKQTNTYTEQEIYSTQSPTLYKKDLDVPTTEYPSILKDLFRDLDQSKYVPQSELSKAPEQVSTYQPIVQNEHDILNQYAPVVHTETYSTYLPIVYIDYTTMAPPPIVTHPPQQSTISYSSKPHTNLSIPSTQPPPKTSKTTQYHTGSSKRPKTKSHPSHEAKPEFITLSLNGNPVSTSVPKMVKISHAKPVLTIRVKAPRLSIRNITVKPAFTTRKPTTTKKRDNDKHNYDLCLDSCRERKDPICASPAGLDPIDTNKLKGFPSLCHMACNNSFKKDQTYEKIADGRCGKLRTRIRTVEREKLKREDLNKAQYTVYHTKHEAVVQLSTLQR